MAHNQRDLACTDKVQCSSNDFGKKLQRSPSFGDWNSACDDLKPLEGKPEVKIEPYTNELPYPKNPTRVSEDCLGERKQMLSPRKNPMTTQHRATPALGPDTKPSTILQFYSGMKRKASATDLMVLPAPSPLVGAIHKSSVDDFFCEICQVNCSSSVTLSHHLKGKKRKAKLMWSREIRNSDGGPEGSPRCNICQIFCTDLVGLEMHNQGKKHKARQGLENGELDIKKSVRCELCQVNCMSEDLYQQHLKGKQHVYKDALARRNLH